LKLREACGLWVEESFHLTRRTLYSEMWVPCDNCEEFWCTVHLKHAWECPCAPIEEWETDPYE